MATATNATKGNETSQSATIADLPAQVLTSYVEMASASTSARKAFFETVFPTLSEKDGKSVKAALLVKDSANAATVLEKWLIREKDRQDGFSDDLTTFITKSNEIAEVFPRLFDKRRMQGRSTDEVYKVVFPTMYGVLTVTLK